MRRVSTDLRCAAHQTNCVYLLLIPTSRDLRFISRRAGAAARRTHNEFPFHQRAPRQDRRASPSHQCDFPCTHKFIPLCVLFARYTHDFVILYLDAVRSIRGSITKTLYVNYRNLLHDRARTSEIGSGKPVEVEAPPPFIQQSDFRDEEKLPDVANSPVRSNRLPAASVGSRLSVNFARYVDFPAERRFSFRSPHHP